MEERVRSGGRERERERERERQRGGIDHARCIPRKRRGKMLESLTPTQPASYFAFALTSVDELLKLFCRRLPRYFGLAIMGLPI